MMKLYFRVRSVHLSRGSSAVTFEPLQWLREDPAAEPVTIGGETFPGMSECDPGEPGAEPFEPGGAKTELRIEEETDLRPDDYVAVSVDRIELLESSG